MVYIVELALFNGFNCVYRRTCTVQSVYLWISTNLYCSKCLIVDIDELVLYTMYNCVYRRTCTSSNDIHNVNRRSRTVHKCLMVYIVELVLFIKCLLVDIDVLVLFKMYNCVYRRTCTVQNV